MTDRIHDMTEQKDIRNEKESDARYVKEAFVLPKNIRQMGQPGHRHKFYIEDYVYTYLHTFLKEKHQEDTLQAAVLLGRQEQMDDCCYTFISGAAACDFSVFYEGGDCQIQESIDRHFPGRQIAGWYVRCTGQDAHVQSVIKHYYAEHGGRRSLSFIYEDDLEDAFDVYVWEQNALRPLEGFYIYYEKNPQMQEFLIWEKGGQASEPPMAVSDSLLEEGKECGETRPEVVCASAKQGGQDRSDIKTETEPAAELLKRRSLSNRQKNSHRVLYAACAVVLLVAVATGVTQMGNYQNLKNFPKTIQTMSDGILHRQKPAAEKTGETEPVDLETESSFGDEHQGETETQSQSLPGDEQPDTEKEENREADTQSVPGENSASEDGRAGSEENKSLKAATENETDQQTQEEERKQAGALKRGYYTVKKGDSLLSISRDLYKTDVMVDAICAENGISNVDVIYEGQKLRLP